MRILCLHGVAGNARMFESQTSHITSVLKQFGHEFVYVDGIMECDQPGEVPDERIKQIYPPPYLAFYKAPIPSDVEEAIDLLESIIEDEGPFDGILGFSQGCCVAASLMFSRYKQQQEQQSLPSPPPPFRFAVFIGASLPFNTSDHTGKEIWNTISTTGLDPRNEFAGELELLQSGQRFMLANPDTDDQKVWLRRYHPQTTPDAKLRIPVLHVIGRHDPYRRQAWELTRMHEFEGDCAIVEHEGAHEVPREKALGERIAKQMLVMMGMC